MRALTLLPRSWRTRARSVNETNRPQDSSRSRALASIGVVVAGCLAFACGAPTDYGDDDDAGEGDEGGAAGQTALGQSGQSGQSGEGGAGGMDSAVDCGEHVSVRTARRARSSGYTGTEEDYFALYDESCEEAADCARACEAAGGEQAMCDASECVDEFDAGRTCLPAPVWRNLDNILFEGTSLFDGVELTLVDGEYHDLLLTDDFQHEVPPNAEILGITTEVRRGGDRVADYSVRILKGGSLGEAERARPEVWTPELTWITYGDAEDRWEEDWEAADVTASDFGVAIALTYTHDSGNSRAYVDQVRTTVHYRVACD